MICDPGSIQGVVELTPTLKRGRVFLTYSWLRAGSPSHSIAITVARSLGEVGGRPVILNDKSSCVKVNGLPPTNRRTDFTFVLQPPNEITEAG